MWHKSIGILALFPILIWPIAHAKEHFCRDDKVTVDALPLALRSETSMWAPNGTVSIASRSEVDAVSTTPIRLSMKDYRVLRSAQVGFSNESTAIARQNSFFQLSDDLPSLAQLKYVQNISYRGQDSSNITSLANVLSAYDVRLSLPNPSVMYPRRVIPKEDVEQIVVQKLPRMTISEGERALMENSTCDVETVQHYSDVARRLERSSGILEPIAPLLWKKIEALSTMGDDETKRKDAREFISAYKKYIASCFAPAWPSAGAVEKLKSRIGVLEADGTGFCTALLLSHRYAITARHCFFDPVTNSRIGHQYVPDKECERDPLKCTVRPASELNIWLALDNPKERTQVCAIANRDAPTPFGPADDFLILRVASSGRAPVKMSVAAPDTLQTDSSNNASLGLVGFMPGADRLLGSRLVRYLGAGCFVTRVDSSRRRCFMHMCGTVGGASGAPVFLERLNAVGEPQLIGLHIGPASEQSAALRSAWQGCNWSDFDFVNVGNFVPESVLRDVQ